MPSLHDRIAQIHRSLNSGDLQAAVDDFELTHPLWARGKVNREIRQKNVSLASSISYVGAMQRLSSLEIGSVGTGYAPREIVTLNGGSLDAIGHAGQIIVATTKVISVSLNLAPALTISSISVPGVSLGNVATITTTTPHGIPAQGATVGISGGFISDGLYPVTYVDANTVTTPSQGWSSGSIGSGAGGTLVVYPVCFATAATPSVGPASLLTGAGSRATVRYTKATTGSVAGVSLSGFGAYVGSYTTNPTDLSNVPLSIDGVNQLTTLAGAPVSVAITMGINTIAIINGGGYADTATTAFTQSSTSGTGSGAQFVSATYEQFTPF